MRSKAFILLIGLALAACGKKDLSFELRSPETDASVGPTIVFNRDVPPVSGQQYWVTLVRPGSPDSTWGIWKYVPSGVRELQLAPALQPGDWEVRLHDLYPKHAFGIVARRSLKVTGQAPHSEGLEFDLVEGSVRAPNAAKVRFKTPVPETPGQQYWITVCSPEAADSEWGAWKYVPAGSVELELNTVAAGDWEVRLHDLYPRASYGVLHRANLKVLP